MLASLAAVKVALSVCTVIGALLSNLAADSGRLAEPLPPDARPGECYAKVYVPPEYRTETFAIVPFRYQWAEEQVWGRGEPVNPGTREQSLAPPPTDTDWEVDNNQPARDVLRLTDESPAHRQVQIHFPWKPARVELIGTAPDHRTIRGLRLVSSAPTHTAEYTEVERTVKISDEKVVWKRVSCETDQTLLTEAPSAAGAMPKPGAMPKR